MNKAEKFISNCIRNCSNELCVVEDKFGMKVISYHEWLTPDQALRAVEIAREEIYEWIKNNAYSYTWRDYLQHERGMEIGKLIDDLKQAIKDE